MNEVYVTSGVFCFVQFRVGTNIELQVLEESSYSFTVTWVNTEADTFNQYRITYSPDHNDRPNAQQSPRIISVSTLGTATHGSLLIYGLDPGQLYTVTLETLYNGVQTDDAFGRVYYRTRNLNTYT